MLSYDNSTAMYKFVKNTFTLAGFEPGIFCSLGGRDDHYTTSPGLGLVFLQIGKLVLTNTAAYYMPTYPHTRQ
jgi:hypothetical protein